MANANKSGIASGTAPSNTVTQKGRRRASGDRSRQLKMPPGWTDADVRAIRNSVDLNEDVLAIVRGYGRFVPGNDVVDSRAELFISGGDWTVKSHDSKFGMSRIWANDRHLLIDKQPVKLISLRDRFRARDNLTGKQIVERLTEECLLTGEHFLNACMLDHIVHSRKLSHAQNFAISQVLGLVARGENEGREVLFLGTQYLSGKAQRGMVRTLVYASCSGTMQNAYRTLYLDSVWDISKLDVAVVARPN